MLEAVVSQAVNALAPRAGETAPIAHRHRFNVFLSSSATMSAKQDKATTERHARTLRELLKRPENKACADCKRNGMLFVRYEGASSLD